MESLYTQIVQETNIEKAPEKGGASESQKTKFNNKGGEAGQINRCWAAKVHELEQSV